MKDNKEKFKFTLFNTLMFSSFSMFLAGSTFFSLMTTEYLTTAIYSGSLFILSLFMFKVMLSIFFKLHSRDYKRVVEETKFQGN